MVEPTHRDIRRLILIGCVQAQKPLILKAFGIQDLSYSTFVSVSIYLLPKFIVFLILNINHVKLKIEYINRLFETK